MCGVGAGRCGEAVNTWVAVRMDTLASSCSVAGIDRQVGSSGPALTSSMEAQSVGEGLGLQPEGERSSRVGNEAAGR